MQISYRLIKVSPLAGPRPTNNLEDMLHLALTAFTTTLFLGFGSALLRAPLLPASLRDSAQRYRPEDKESQQLLLWVLLVGRASVFTDLDECWLVPKMREIGVALELRTWEDIWCVLIQFPWVNLVHGRAGRALWEKSDIYSGLPS
jgi:hypothetical protein